LAETIPGPSTDALGKIAKKYCCVIIASLFERRAAGLYHNTAAIIETDGSIKGIYRKMHIPDDPLYYEKFYFTPGDACGEHAGFKAWDTTYAKIGVLICWDQWYPEAARLTALQGAEILFYPTAIGWHPSEKTEYGVAQHESWELIQRSHAVANGCFTCSPNRIGIEHILDTTGKPVSKDGIEFWGQSFIASPNGQIVEKASIDKEQVLVVPCDLEKVEFSRTHWPFLRDRRIDAYGDITKRFVDAS
jgi:N-carbamoylputrescine amidase